MSDLIHIPSDASQPPPESSSAVGFDEGGRYVHEDWADAPCDDGARVPPGWMLDETGGQSARGSTFHGQVVMTGTFEDVEQGDVFVGLSFKWRGTWKAILCPRTQLSRTSAIVALADQGLDVDSTTAGALVEYLSAYERQNQNLIPLTRVGRRLGWYEERGFLCGQEWIAMTSERPIQFRGEGPEADQLISGIHRNGTLAEWCDAIEAVKEHPRVMLGVYASLATPLLGIVPAPNLIISYEGRTSVGKSTSQIAAASCWGNPFYNGSDPSFVFPWNCTPVFLERLAAISNGVPLILDDTSSLSARNQIDIGNAIYQFTSGSSRGRGNRRGLDRRRDWQSVMISSGEAPLTSFSQFGGTRARVLPVTRPPFPPSPASAELVARLREQLRMHFGHAAPEMISYLQENMDQASDWNSQYQELCRHYESRAGGHPVKIRMAAGLAFLDLAGRLVHQAIPFSWAYGNVVDELWAELTADAEDSDRGRAALEGFYSWATREKRRFDHDSLVSNAATPRHGKWRWSGMNGEPCLLVYEDILNKFLKKEGYNAEEIRRNWKERGWLRTEELKTTIRVMMSKDGQRCPVVAIRWSAIQELMNQNDQSGSTD